MHPDARLIHKCLWGLSVLLILLCAAPAVAQRDRENEGWRVKIDAVDVSQAPNVRVFLSFLDPKSRPVNPKAVDLAEVLIDDDQRLEVPRGDVSLWRDQPEGTDLVLVLPATATISKPTQEVIATAMDEMVKGLREEDRVGLVTYSYAVSAKVKLGEDRSKLKSTYADETFKGTRPFMFSAIDKAITMLETSPEGRKRAIVFVGDGSDASNVIGEELSEKLHDLVSRARTQGVRVWTLGYDPKGINKFQVRSLQLLSRKTGATYRDASSQRDFGARFDHIIGEIIGQLVLEVRGDFTEGQTYKFKAKMQAFKSPELVTRAHKLPVEEVRFNWLLWGIVCGVTCIVVGIISLVSFIVVIRTRRRVIREDAELELADLLEDKPEEEGEEEEPLFVYTEQGAKICNTCGREARPEWATCPYDERGKKPLPEWEEKKREQAALLGGAGAAPAADPEQAKKAAEEAAEKRKLAAEEAKKRASALRAGGKECPKCKKIMDPKWPECLYCAGGM